MLIEWSENPSTQKFIGCMCHFFLGELTELAGPVPPRSAQQASGAMGPESFIASPIQGPFLLVNLLRPPHPLPKVHRPAGGPFPFKAFNMASGRVLLRWKLDETKPFPLSKGFLNDTGNFPDASQLGGREGGREGVESWNSGGHCRLFLPDGSASASVCTADLFFIFSLQHFIFKRSCPASTWATTGTPRTSSSWSSTTSPTSSPSTTTPRSFSRLAPTFFF